jgi:hypothetical protein
MLLYIMLLLMLGHLLLSVLLLLLLQSWLHIKSSFSLVLWRLL